jgi:hypothetical protein
MINKERTIALSIVAIAAVIVLFATGPLAATKAQAYWYGFHRGYGFHHFHQFGHGFHHFHHFGYGFHHFHHFY